MRNFLREWGALTLFVYLFTGFFIFVWCAGSTNGALGLPIAQATGVAVLWPLFAIKYLAIGLWAVVYSGFTLLF